VSAFFYAADDATKGREDKGSAGARRAAWSGAVFDRTCAPVRRDGRLAALAVGRSNKWFL